ncbi:MAG: sel1 repeat family protein [Rhodobacteraceae bacterium]|nr:sel1 repeat family protein [Paracoccaceae bacterium]
MLHYLRAFILQVVLGLYCFAAPSGVLAQTDIEAQTEAARAAYIAGDYVTAMDLAVEPANAGIGAAQNILGIGYNMGQGLEQDIELAVLWFESAIENGSAKAAHNLGTLMRDGGPGFAANPVRARSLFEQAVAQDFTPALTALGYMYDHGLGGPALSAEANALFVRALAAGDVAASEPLAHQYLEGRFVAQDDTIARALFADSAAIGDAQSTNNLGIMNELGRGGPVDLNRARQLYLQSVSGGQARAGLSLATLIYDNPEMGSREEQYGYCFWALRHADPSNQEPISGACQPMIDALNAKQAQAAGFFADALDAP